MDRPPVDIVPLAPPAGGHRAIRVPGSKSLTNRALVCALLAEGESVLDGILLADDTEAMLGAIEVLGARVERDGERVRVAGVSGRIRGGEVELDVAQSGTTSRFLLPVLGLGEGLYTMDGHPQLRARPFDGLVATLTELGADIRGESLPLTVRGAGLSGGRVSLPGSTTSQFLSGLLLSAPAFSSPLVIEVAGQLVSKPYIGLTLDVMEAFGGRVDRVGWSRFSVANGGYRATDYRVEPDASAASYFFAAAAMTGLSVTVEGLGTESRQGDMALVAALERMGALVEQTPTATTVTGTGHLTGIEIDMADFSDTVQTLAMVAVVADGPTRMTGIGFIRRKETDRIGAVVVELGSLGIRAEAEPDAIVIYPGQPRPGTVDTYDDHRMAMSFALLGLVAEGISIAGPGCVAKTFPGYFETLDSLRG